MKSNIFGYIASTFCLIILDRLTKLWALRNCMQETIFLNNYAECTIVTNSGMAWSLLASNNTIINIVLLACILLVTIIMTVQAYQRLLRNYSIWPEVLIIAGAIGNSVDRIRYGQVIDFIHLHYQDYSWPIFNIADICIVLGVLLLFLRLLRNKE